MFLFRKKKPINYLNCTVEYHFESDGIVLFLYSMLQLLLEQQVVT